MAAARGVGFAKPPLPAVNWTIVPVFATSIAPCSHYVYGPGPAGDARKFQPLVSPASVV